MMQDFKDLDEAATTGTSSGPIKADAGKREFGTGAHRGGAKNKGRFDLLPGYAMQALANHYEHGAAIYGENNWRKGQPLSVYLDAALRHLFKHQRGEREEPHLLAAAWNIMSMIDTAEMIKRSLLPAELDNLIAPVMDAICGNVKVGVAWPITQTISTNPDFEADPGGWVNAGILAKRFAEVGRSMGRSASDLAASMRRMAVDAKDLEAERKDAADRAKAAELERRIDASKATLETLRKESEELKAQGPIPPKTDPTPLTRKEFQRMLGDGLTSALEAAKKAAPPDPDDLKPLKLRCYYAHPITLYGEEEEKLDLIDIANAGWAVINPNTERFQEIFRTSGSGAGMTACKIAIEEWADILVYRTFDDGKIGAGVMAEIATARNKGIPIFQFRNIRTEWVLSIDETRTRIREIRAQRELDRGAGR